MPFPRQEDHTIEAMMSRLKVKHEGRGTTIRYIGFFVKWEFAQRFLARDPSERKVVDVRNMACKRLAPGDRVALISSWKGDRVTTRVILGILEFQACTSHKGSEFQKYFALHRVSDEEFLQFRQQKPNATWFGYHFRLVHAFRELLQLSVMTGEVWIWFNQSDCRLPNIECGNPSRKRESEMLQDASPPSKMSKKSPMPIHTDSETGEDNRLNEQTVHADDSAASADPDFSCEEDIDDLRVSSNSSNSIMCLLLSLKEWNSLVQGLAAQIIRPFRSATKRLVVLTPGGSSDQVVGVIYLSAVEEIKNWNSKSLVHVRDASYSRELFASMKRNKSSWTWTVKDVEKYSSPHTPRMLDIAPRHRNRPFAVPVDVLQDVATENGPSTQSFQATAKYFCGQIQNTHDQHYRNIVGTLRQISMKSGRIRVGTTCSGSDICIPMLRQTLQHIKEEEARVVETIVCRIKQVLCCTYIYIYII